jgi:hypothetical protein
MSRKSFGRNVIWAGMAALALTGFPVRAAIGPGNPGAAPARSDETCTQSTESIRLLAMIDSTHEDKFQCLGLYLEGDTVKGIRLETHSFASAHRDPGSEQVEITEFAVAVVESSRGAVLDGVPGHDAIILQGHLSTAPVTAKLVYLYNGITNEYRSCPITIDRGPDAGWRLVNRFNQTVSHIVVRTRRIPLVGPFGIAELEGACTPLDL